MEHAPGLDSEEAFTSDPVIFIVGGERTPFYLHQHPISQLCPALDDLVHRRTESACEGKVFWSEDRIIWADISIGNFCRLVSFAYTHEYPAPTPEGSRPWTVIPAAPDLGHDEVMRDGDAGAGGHLPLIPFSSQSHQPPAADGAIPQQLGGTSRTPTMTGSETAESGSARETGPKPFCTELPYSVDFFVAMHEWYQVAHGPLYWQQFVQVHAKEDSNADEHRENRRKRKHEERDGGSGSGRNATLLPLDLVRSPRWIEARRAKIESMRGFYELSACFDSALAKKEVQEFSSRRARAHRHHPPMYQLRPLVRRDSNISYGILLLAHADMYLLAKLCSNEDLRQLSLSRLHRVLLQLNVGAESLHDLIILTQVIWSNTYKGDESQNMMVDFWACFKEHLSNVDEFEELIGDVGGFAVAIVNKILSQAS